MSTDPRNISTDPRNIKKVVVAMSGGVDSSVAALLLKEQGYEVIGITLNIWPSSDEDESRNDKKCCALGAVEDARRVAARLDIPHYVLNYRELFHSTVIEDFISEYSHARTPNPCIRCNQWIKFGHLMTQAVALEADAVATGHYADLRFDAGRRRWIISISDSGTKDQTYALYSLTQEQLSRTIFPLANLRKEQARELAREAGLSVADKGESQEICFVEGSYVDFLTSVGGVKPIPGPIENVAGELIGEHEGLINYTIGQRKGLGVSLPYPAYVVRMDPENNRLIVGAKKEAMGSRFSADQCNWIAREHPHEGMKVRAQIRYNMEPTSATILAMNENADSVEVRFDKEQFAPAPGQAAVFYEGNDLLGGGLLRL